MSLFRPDAVNHQKNRFEGEILLTRPPSSVLLTLCASAFVLGFILFIAIGKYTQKQRVDGVLIADKGIVKVVSSQPGTIEEVLVQEGQHVTKGQTLYVVNSDRSDSAGHLQQGEKQAQLKDQLQRLEEQSERQRSITNYSIENLNKKKDSLLQQIKSLTEGNALAEEQAALAERNLERYRSLSVRQYASALEVEQKEQEVLGQRARIKDLLRARLAMELDLANTEKELQTVSLQGGNDISSLRRSQSSLQQEISASEVDRQTLVRASISGIATAVLVKVGQTVSTQPLLTIVPDGAELLAELYVPTQSIAFTKIGTPVQVRYPAFPYQKFGQHRGLVREISQVAINSSELSRSVSSQTSGGATNGDSVYRVIVGLPSQSIQAYGRREALHTGMRIEADILRDTRRIYEWLLEPLYSITGSF